MLFRSFAGVMNGLGTKVTQYYRGAQVLRGFDDEARGLVAEEMIQNGIDLHLGTDILSLEKDGGGIRVKATNGTEQVFETVLFATGRRPNTDDMGLEQAGVRLGRGGEVLVDAYSKTDVDSIWAVERGPEMADVMPLLQVIKDLKWALLACPRKRPAKRDRSRSTPPLSSRCKLPLRVNLRGC